MVLYQRCIQSTTIRSALTPFQSIQGQWLPSITPVVSSYCITQHNNNFVRERKLCVHIEYHNNSREEGPASTSLATSIPLWDHQYWPPHVHLRQARGPETVPLITR
jgi:hypothetical protein